MKRTEAQITVATSFERKKLLVLSSQQFLPLRTKRGIWTKIWKNLALKMKRSRRSFSRKFLFRRSLPRNLWSPRCRTGCWTWKYLTRIWASRSKNQDKRKTARKTWSFPLQATPRPKTRPILYFLTREIILIIRAPSLLPINLLRLWDHQRTLSRRSDTS